MNDSTTTTSTTVLAVPSRRLRRFAQATRWLLGVALAAWLGLALTAGVLHGFIVPRIDQFRPWLEARASRALGAPLMIGRITARSSGLFPSFELSEVALLDAAGQPALRVERALVSVSALSLWRLGVEQIYLEQPQLRLRRDRDGRFALGSLRFGAGGGAGADDSGEVAADWLFAQPELVIERGSVSLLDESEAASAAPLTLESLRLVLRNQGRRHSARLDANWDQDRSRPLTLVAVMREPLLSQHASRWRNWSGRLYADLPPLELAQLARHAHASIIPDSGRAALRIWADLDRAEWVHLSADVALTELRARLPESAEPVVLQSFSGRIDWHALEAGFDLSLQRLALQTADGAVWPGRELRLTWQPGDARHAGYSAFAADRIDLGLLTKLARSLPLATDVRAALERLAAKGSVEALDASWRGPPGTLPRSYRISGRASDIEIAAQPAPPTRAPARNAPGMPGVRGASGLFDFNENGGKAALRIDGGAISFPGIFEEPLLPIARLSVNVTWQVSADRWQVEMPDLKFENTDAAGSARLLWRTSDSARAKGRSRLPGAIELDGTLERANVARVHRYLPLELPQPVQRYLRDALVAGSASAVRFQVKGELREFPFIDPAHGNFHITADLRDSTFAFAPASLQPAGKPPWPPLTQMSGELVLERAALRVNHARGRFGTAPGLPIAATSASIANLDRALIAVDAQLHASLPELLKTVRTSPIGALLDDALMPVVGSGDVQLKLKLALPLEQLDHSTVQGSLTLAGNDLRPGPDSPSLKRANGEIAFTERGFNFAGVTAQLYGGEVRIEGGSVARTGTLPRDDRAALVELRAHGTVTAQGLRGATEAGLLAQLAPLLSGATGYDAMLRIRHDGPELVVTSDLHGLAISLPAPLAKPAGATLPMHFETAPLANAQDQVSLSLGEIVSVRYQRALSGRTARVLHGNLRLGLVAASSSPPLPPSPSTGVVARVELARFDLDSWADAIAEVQEAAAVSNSSSAGSQSAAPERTAAQRGYWPTQWQARVGQFAASGFVAHDLTLQGSRDGALWRTEVDAEELAGRVEYRESPDGDGPGRVRARLARLVLADPKVADSALPAPRKLGTKQLPALDVVVEDFELHGRSLGKVEIDAVNRHSNGETREWRLNKLEVSTPEAKFFADGKWMQPAGGSSGSEAQTALDFRLDIADSGRLLERFGMKDIVQQGHGMLAGRLAWNGSPLALDYPSLDGQFHLDVETGQFLKADPGLAKLLGVLSLQALPRRLSLDFRDLFSTGFAFDFIRGDVAVQRGKASSNNLQMKGASAAVLMEGYANIEAETQRLRVVVVPEIDAGTAALVATAINPALGLGTFLAQYFLRKPLSRAATQEFLVDGAWSNPHITKISARPAPWALSVQQQGAPLAADSSR